MSKSNFIPPISKNEIKTGLPTLDKFTTGGLPSNTLSNFYGTNVHSSVDVFKILEKEVNNYTMEIINSVLKTAREHELETEVVFFAILEIRNNPKISTSQAMINSLHEWVK